MTVKKLSKKNEQKHNEPREDLVDQFISGGGKITEEARNEKEAQEDTTRFTIRIPNALVECLAKYVDP